ncbi:MAG: hypothetical protein JW944_12045, partial [Deltaproteobacteria bacterium]|nr:hypothetical protein [Deltaproteobacteria bacterium]
VLSTPEGLAVAFACEQPYDTRTRTVSSRDSGSIDADSVILIVDFDGTSTIGYEFRVSITGSYSDGTILREDQHNRDWDGIWKRAVYEDEENWYAEMLLPWSIAPMNEGDSETRRIGISFQRRLYSTGETFAFPGEIYDSSHGVSNAAKIDIARHSAGELDISPYISVLGDLVNDSATGKAGVDLSWKPSGRFQVTAAINPDFGQVESDNLVIDFSAFETYFSDKRPFFTENQGIFDVSRDELGRLVYTRRVGAIRDDGKGASDIDGAIKAIGSAGPVKYGAFTAQESGDIGRTFYAGRVLYAKEKWNVGMLSSYVDRPFFDRTARVDSIDYHLSLFGNSMRWVGQFMRSDIDKPSGDSSGFGAWTGIDYTPSKERSYVLYMIHYDDKLDINDMGFLRRNNYEELMCLTSWEKTDFSEDSAIASVYWLIRGYLRRNTHGERLPASFMLSRFQDMRSGDSIGLNLTYETGGYDDIFSRGYDIMYVNERWNGSASYNTPRRGSWSRSFGLKIFQEGYDNWAAGINGSSTWYPDDKLNIAFSLDATWSRDWLNWLQENQVGAFSRRQLSGRISGNWFPAEKHEFRLLSQWIIVNAGAIQGYFIGADGRLEPDSFPVNDFAAMNFGLQLRYRYELAPLSYFYLVYSRGGFDYINEPDKSTEGLLFESTDLRDSDQIMAKLQYRF